MVSNRTVVRVVLIAVGIVLALYVLWRLGEVIGLLVVSAFLAAALGPAVSGLERLRIPRIVSVLIVFVGILLGLIGVGFILVPAVVEQVNGLVDSIPRLIDSARRNPTFMEYDDRYGITEAIGRQLESLPQRAEGAVGAAQTVTVGVFSGLVQLFTALVLTFILLLDGRRLRELFLAQLDPARVPRARQVGERVYRAVAGYVIGNIAISLVAGLSAYVVLKILDVPFAGALAVVMAVLDLIPIVGASIAGVLIGIFAAIQDFPTALIVWGVFLLLYQQVENNLLQPIVYRRTVELRPLTVIVAVLVGGTLFGVVGALLAIPTAAAIEILIETYRPLKTTPAPEAPPSSPPPEPPGAGGPRPETA